MYVRIDPKVDKRNIRHLTYFMVLLTVVITGCHRNPNAPISDAELIRIDKTKFNKRTKMSSHEVIGVSRGAIF